MKKLVSTAFLILFVTAVSMAATVDGAWKGYVEGQYNITVNLKTAAGKVTGTLNLVDNNAKSENPDDAGYSPFVSAQMGKNTIANGKAAGETITFNTTFNGKPIVYKGVLQGEKLILTTTYNGQNVKITLSRAKA
jgi:hypothetical protein